MLEHDIVCQECESEFTVIAHNISDAPSFCPFCGHEDLVEEADE